MATDTIITASPRAIPTMAMEMMGREIFFSSELSEYKRLAIYSSVFNLMSVSGKCIKIIFFCLSEKENGE